MGVEVIAVRDESDAEPLEAILLQTGRRRRLLLEWWGGYASGAVSKNVQPEDVLSWPGWRPLAMELPYDWQEGYLRAVGGNVEFIKRGPSSPSGIRRRSKKICGSPFGCRICSRFGLAAVSWLNRHRLQWEISSRPPISGSVIRARSHRVRLPPWLDAHIECISRNLTEQGLQKSGVLPKHDDSDSP